MAVPEIPSTDESGGGSGNAVANQPTGPAVAPVVTFGDGRTPGMPAAEPDVAPTPIVESAAPASVPPAAPPPPPLSLPLVPQALAGQSFQMTVPDPPVMRLWEPMRSDSPTAALFGIAGLILAPIAGIWLGYRQARAAKSAKSATQLVSS
ncbi:MAG: hypothetical protein ABW137_22815 [Mycobacterium sp.]